MSVGLQVLAEIALTLYILFGYVIPAQLTSPEAVWFRPVVSIIVIVVILLLWFVLPVRVG